jgi:hypothetical protein
MFTATAPHAKSVDITIIAANHLWPEIVGAATLLDRILANSRMKVGAAKIIWMTAITIKTQVRSIIQSPNVTGNGIANR